MNLPIFVLVSQLLDGHIDVEVFTKRDEAESNFEKAVSDVSAEDKSTSRRGHSFFHTEAGSFVKLVRK